MAGWGTGNARVRQGVEIPRYHVPVPDPEIFLGHAGQERHTFYRVLGF